MEETVVAPAAEAPASDDIGSIVRAQLEKQDKATQLSGTPTPAAEAAVVEAKPAEVKPAEVKPAEVKPGEAETAPVVPEAKRSQKMPTGWKHGADVWHTMPEQAKDFIAQREADINRGIQMYSTAANFGTSLAGEFLPYDGLLRSLGATPQTATRYLLSTYARLTTGTPTQKKQALGEIATDLGIDLGELAQNGVPQESPELKALRDHVQRLEQGLSQQHQQRQSAETMEIHGEIERFAQDPAHEHFEACRPTMAVLLKEGQAKTMDEAYEKAKWLVPEIRASLISQHEAQEREKRKKEAEAAQRAAVSVTGAPPGAGAKLGEMSLHDAIAAQVHASMSGGGRV